MKDEGEAAEITVAGSQGVQVGTGNTQYLNWGAKQPLDPAVLSGRNPHAAVALLRQLTHEELVDFFIRANPGDVSEILGVFAEVDMPKLIATIGDISRRKATELINSIEPDDYPAGLDEVLGAAEEIARKAARLGWADAEPLEHFLEGGYARKYNEGHVFWSRSSGVVRTTGAIDHYWVEGGTDFGFPVENHTGSTSPYGTTGFRQRFQPGAVYSSRHGIFLVTDDMCYQNEGGSGDWLGFPVSDRERDERLGGRQMFEGGAIYSHIVEGPEGLESFPVRRQVTNTLSGWMFFPVSKEVATESSFGTSGKVQRFKLLQSDIWNETAVYSFADRSTMIVKPEIWSYYQELGAESSRLGFPSIAPELWQKRTPVPVPPTVRKAVPPAGTPAAPPAIDALAALRARLVKEKADETPAEPEIPPALRARAGQRLAAPPAIGPEAKSKARERRQLVQFFEGGCIQWRFDTGPFAVTSPVFETIGPELQLRDKLGWPVSEALTIGAGETDLIQFFESGNVTFRNRKGEVWLRPASQEPSRPEDTRTNF